MLAAAGLETERLKLIDRDMADEDAAAHHLDAYLPDADGCTHVQMVRLEVQARKAR